MASPSFPILDIGELFMDDKTRRIEELQFLGKYPKNVTIYQDMCNFELSSIANEAYQSILSELRALDADDVILVEMCRWAVSARSKQYQQAANKESNHE